ncbi:hypothetical protein V501_07542 [Pseudogymnoascus sp. VKM F-4519 (FW-2642)]|nr:hypothetical protein V501_07542 [Pseudogymnoascus sp. VKM F-4519 (FW-2642)]
MPPQPPSCENAALDEAGSGHCIVASLRTSWSPTHTHASTGEDVVTDRVGNLDRLGVCWMPQSKIRDAYAPCLLVSLVIRVFSAAVVRFVPQPPHGSGGAAGAAFLEVDWRRRAVPRGTVILLPRSAKPASASEAETHRLQAQPVGSLATGLVIPALPPTPHHFPEPYPG